jgi:hypothetical protein
MEYEFRAVVMLSEETSLGDYDNLDMLVSALRDAGIIVEYACLGLAGEMSAEIFNTEVL